MALAGRWSCTIVGECRTAVAASCSSKVDVVADVVLAILADGNDASRVLVDSLTGTLALSSGVMLSSSQSWYTDGDERDDELRCVTVASDEPDRCRNNGEDNAAIESERRNNMAGGRELAPDLDVARSVELAVPHALPLVSRLDDSMEAWASMFSTGVRGIMAKKASRAREEGGGGANSHPATLSSTSTAGSGGDLGGGRSVEAWTLPWVLVCAMHEG